MENFTALIKLLLVLPPLWVVISSPLLLVFYLVARRMKRTGVRSEVAYLAFAVVAASLVAHVPTPIITILVPLGWALADPSYAEAWDAFPREARPWIATSAIATFVAAYVVVKRIVGSRGPRTEIN